NAIAERYYWKPTRQLHNCARLFSRPPHRRSSRPGGTPCHQAPTEAAPTADRTACASTCRVAERRRDGVTSSEHTREHQRRHCPDGDCPEQPRPYNKLKGTRQVGECALGEGHRSIAPIRNRHGLLSTEPPRHCALT